MIQSILFFALGFLCAGLIALLIAPAIWRRAVRLTRKRVEASVPLTQAQIQADKDRLRAEFAMKTRRLEMSAKSLREKAAAQVIEISRNREALKALSEQRQDKSLTLMELEAKTAELNAELRQKEDQLQSLTKMLAEAEQTSEQRTMELDKIGRLYDEASFSSSSRQIELVARESEVEKLTGEISALRRERKDAERRCKEAIAESRAARDALKAEKKRAGDLQKKVERMLETLTDREEKLASREREMAHLRATLKAGSTGDGDALETAVASLSEERDRLEERLALLTRENRKLKDDMEAGAQSGATPDGEEQERAMLREQMNDLAAEVVNLTAMLEGPDSPIAKALAAPADHARPIDDKGQTVTSLADRVRALQQKAASAN